jgi:hypothetical protein
MDKLTTIGARVLLKVFILVIAGIAAIAAAQIWNLRSNSDIAGAVFGVIAIGVFLCFEYVLFPKV